MLESSSGTLSNEEPDELAKVDVFTALTGFKSILVKYTSQPPYKNGLDKNFFLIFFHKVWKSA